MSECKLVPTELARPQLRAMISAYEDAMDGGDRLPDGDGYDEVIVQAMHKAMLDSTPEHTEQPQTTYGVIRKCSKVAMDFVQNEIEAEIDKVLQ